MSTDHLWRFKWWHRIHGHRTHKTGCYDCMAVRIGKTWHYTLYW